MKVPIILILIAFGLACRSNDMSTPKPRMYPKYELPEPDYTSFHDNDCPLNI